MNPPRCTDTEYIDFLVATPRAPSVVSKRRAFTRAILTLLLTMPSPASCIASLPILPPSGAKSHRSWTGRAAC
jgi:hypothetical protein